MHKRNTNSTGFTIVELLIVVVVIAILAAISIVAYTGIQQRATNSSIISAVSQSVKLISGYIAANGAYPSIGQFCLTPAESSCTAGGSDQATSSTFIDNLNTIGSVPSSIPNAHPSYDGITYAYYSTRTFNGSVQPLILFYSLRGEQQHCGVANITNSGGANMASSTTGWTVSGSGSGYTICVVSIPGP